MKKKKRSSWPEEERSLALSSSSELRSNTFHPRNSKIGKNNKKIRQKPGILVYFGVFCVLNYRLYPVALLWFQLRKKDKAQVI